MFEKIKVGSIEIYAPRKIVMKALRYVSSGLALDFGCGFGRHSLFLAHKGFTVTAVEQDAEKLESLNRKASQLDVAIQTEQGDIRSSNLEPEKYDLILSTMVLHFLRNREEVTEVIHTMQNATKLNGVNVVCTYTDKSQPDIRPCLMNAEELRDLYNGWEVLRFRELENSDEIIDGPNKGKVIWRVELIARKKVR